MSKVQTEDPRFVRDIHSKALLATDKDALNRHRLSRQATQKFLTEREEHKAELDRLSNTVDKIEKLLMKVLEKDKDGS
jgi:hypothetical protein|tara:strand:+ start:539 stop:772 length:234 start_codon:yes stop_codon:yes gene_type:complete